MIEAAGGVVLRDRDGDAEVLVVHRVHHEDWSLPKGKLDPGESAQAAAVREVEEETGVVAEVVGAELPDVTYPVADGTKHVRWFRMTWRSGDPDARVPDAEVDRARWLPVAEAADLLTYPQDLALVRRVLEGDPA